MLRLIHSDPMFQVTQDQRGQILEYIFSYADLETIELIYKDELLSKALFISKSEASEGTHMKLKNSNLYLEMELFSRVQNSRGFSYRHDDSALIF